MPADLIAVLVHLPIIVTAIGYLTWRKDRWGAR